MDAQIKKGVLEMCVLFLVSEKELYGYDVMKTMKQYFHDVNESTFYSILRRLHNENILETYWGDESNGPKRKYYRITQAGEVYLAKSIEDWKQINAIIHELGIQ